MRILIGAGMVLLFASAAAAQTGGTAAPTPPPPPSACGEAQPAPTLPNAANATAAQMNQGNRTYEAWATDTRAKLACRQAEVRALVAQAAAAEAAFNGQVTAFTNVGNSWQSQVTAFNERHGSSGQSSQRGGVLTEHGPH